MMSRAKTISAANTATDALPTSTRTVRRSSSGHRTVSEVMSIRD